MLARSILVWNGSSTAPRRASGWTSPRSFGCSPRGMLTMSGSLPWRTNCARRSAATLFVTSSTATSTTPTSATIKLQVLRVLQGQDARGAARHALRPGDGGDRPPLAGSLGSRRDRGLPARRHPSRLYRRHLCQHLQGDQSGDPGHAHSCFLAAGGDPGRRDAGPVADGVPGAPEGCGAGHASRHRRGNPR